MHPSPLVDRYPPMRGQTRETGIENYDIGDSSKYDVEYTIQVLDIYQCVVQTWSKYTVMKQRCQLVRYITQDCLSKGHASLMRLQCQDWD